jgi:hypothetical protein
MIIIINTMIINMIIDIIIFMIKRIIRYNSVIIFISNSTA